MRQSLYAYCRQFHKDALLAEWDDVRNLPLTPESVSYGSHRKVWWRCANGHEWKASVYSRTGGTGCPYCTGRRVGQNNDFASLYPALAAQWDAEKNAPRTPSDFSAGRLVAAGENSLADISPELARQWDAEKNAPLTPQQVTAGTRRRVWWKCEKGHSWQASVASRVSQRTDCPVCGGKEVQQGFNDLASLYPALAGEWDAAKNGALTPEEVTPASNRKVWWRCPLGHSYRSIVASRTMRGDDCPYCAGRRVLAGFNDLATKAPDVAAQWHPTLNGSLTPEMVTAGSNRKVWWQCPLGHVWKAVIYSRAGTQRCGCPVCAGNGKRKNVRYDSLPEKTAGKPSAGAQRI